MEFGNPKMGTIIHTGSTGNPLFRNTGEDLHEDLKACLTTRRGLAIHHPLMIEPSYSPELNHFINRRYVEKKKCFEEKIAEEDWWGAIWIYERPYRIELFLSFKDQLLDAEYWEMLRWLWVDSENIWKNRKTWVDLLASHRSGSFMDEEDLETFKGLPEKLVIYRGFMPRKNKNGLSWTLSEGKAQWFADRFAGWRGEVASRRIKRSEVFAYIDSRDEEEIIVLPRNRR